ncbi:unnamed protein product [Linum trigynum]|uniref:Ty3 transposon capsid-like protein domain-containing protein n=1 Tax=Linum trigynum TaxID=586398 RepID=A0AAV2F6L5_9ROSI
MTNTRGTIDERLTALLASTNQAQGDLDDRITNVQSALASQAAQFQEIRTRSEGHSLQFVTLTTRLDSMEANSATRFADLETSSAARLADMEARLDDRFGQFTQEIRNLLQAVVPPRPAGGVAGAVLPPIDRNARGILPLPNQGFRGVDPAVVQAARAERDQFHVHGPGNQNQFHQLPRLDFPPFNGDDPREWTRKCEKLFEIYGIPPDQKVNLAVIYFQRRADLWFEGWKIGRQELNWEEFVAALCQRFGNRTYGGVVAEFNKLRQRGSLADYQEKFEELRSLMSRFNPALDEIYFINSFISGLDEELRPVLHMWKPQTLADAFQFAQLEEASNLAWQKKWCSSQGMSNRPMVASTSTNPIQPRR